jgi:hypothetical protein
MAFSSRGRLFSNRIKWKVLSGNLPFLATMFAISFHRAGISSQLIYHQKCLFCIVQRATAQSTTGIHGYGVLKLIQFFKSAGWTL